MNLKSRLLAGTALPLVLAASAFVGGCATTGFSANNAGGVAMGCDAVTQRGTCVNVYQGLNDRQMPLGTVIAGYDTRDGSPVFAVQMQPDGSSATVKQIINGVAMEGYFSRQQDGYHYVNGIAKPAGTYANYPLQPNDAAQLTQTMKTAMGYATQRNSKPGVYANDTGSGTGVVKIVGNDGTITRLDINRLTVATTSTFRTGATKVTLGGLYQLGGPSSYDFRTVVNQNAASIDATRQVNMTPEQLGYFAETLTLRAQQDMLLGLAAYARVNTTNLDANYAGINFTNTPSQSRYQLSDFANGRFPAAGLTPAQGQVVGAYREGGRDGVEALRRSGKVPVLRLGAPNPAP